MFDKRRDGADRRADQQPGYVQYPPPGAAQYPAPGYPQYPPPEYGQYPPAGSPYGPPAGPGYPFPARQSTNGFAIASMVLGILWIYWLGSILALIFGYVALSQIRQRGQEGRGMALAGVVLGWVGVAALVLFTVLVVSIGFDDPGGTF